MITEVKTAYPDTEGVKSGRGSGHIARVCFVCTGNTCRSPMAAAVANRLCAGRVAAVSCGLSPEPGAPISAFAARALEEAGILSTPDNNYLAHAARRASAVIFEGCDRIYGMTGRHVMALLTGFPEYAEKIFMMPREISDPWGGDMDDYRRCLSEITDGVRELFCA